MNSKASQRWGIRNAVLIAVALVSVAGSAPAIASYPVVPPASPATQADECRLLQLINRDRITNGAAPLRGLQTDATYYARVHARDMAERARLWHDMSALQAAAPTAWTALGENVAYHSSIDAMHAAYMNSPGHRANILNPAFTAVGIGVVRSAGRIYNSEDFIGRSTTWPLLSCSTGPALDSIAPSTITDLAGWIGPSAAVFNWSAATDNVGVAGYIVYRSGIEIGRTSLPWHGDTGYRAAHAAGPVQYSVRAFDTAGNVAVTSNVVHL